MNTKHYAEELRRCVRECGYTTNIDLAKAIDVSASVCCSWLSGKTLPSLDAEKKLFDLFTRAGLKNLDSLDEEWVECHLPPEMNFGIDLKRCRLLAHCSAKDFAALFGVSVSQYMQYESNLALPSHATFARMKEALRKKEWLDDILEPLYLTRGEAWLLPT